MRLEKLLEKTEYTLLQGSMDTDIEEVVYDSRKLVKGSLFVCLKGARFDSHDLAGDMAKQGARALVIEHDLKDAQIPSHICIIKVKNSREALAYISAARFDDPAKKMVTIGVTGTKGKTTSTYMIKTMLEQAGKKVGMIGTNGVFIGEDFLPSINTTPESYELQRYFAKMVEQACDYVVMEVSSQGLKLHRTAAIEFDYAVFTNISPDHIGKDEHQSFEEYLECKTRLFDQSLCSIINRDDAEGEKIYQRLLRSGKKAIGIGKRDGADYRLGETEYIADRGFFGICFEVGGRKNLKAEVGIPGEFNAYNALAAIAVCDLIGLRKEELSRGLRSIHVKGRMEIVHASEDFTVLVDYAHNAVSMESLLDTLRHYRPNRLVVVFGCGGNRSKDRRYSMGEIAGRKADLSIITADNSRFEKIEDILADIRGSIEKTGGAFLEIPDRREAIYYAIDHAKQGDLIAVIGKGHEDYQEINGVRYRFLDREVVEERTGKKRTDESF